MPIPSYIVCAENISIDEESGQVICFRVLDSLSFSKTDLAPEVQATHGLFKRLTSFQFVASWLKSTDDERKEFESQYVCTTPSGSQLFYSQVTKFSFNGPVKRLVTGSIQSKGFPGPGVYTLESKVREVGASEWTTQTFRFSIDEVAGPAQSDPLRN